MPNCLWEPSKAQFGLRVNSGGATVAEAEGQCWGGVFHMKTPKAQGVNAGRNGKVDESTSSMFPSTGE